MAELDVIRCPNCGSGKPGIIDSRDSTVGEQGPGSFLTKRRRRRCHGCDHRWNSFEISEELAGALDLEGFVSAYHENLEREGAEA